MLILPFLAPDMFQLVFNLLERFVTEEPLAEVTSIPKVLQLDLTKNHLCTKTLHVLILGLFKHKKKFSEKDIFSVKADTNTFVIALVKKLLCKAPIRYGLVRNMAWLHH